MSPDTSQYFTATDTKSHRAYRLTSIDFLRGLVMVIMALDHVRDFFTDARFDPADLTQTDSALFLTRWITHFCAPTFVLLSGISAGLMHERKSTGELSRFLATRGLWLIAIEITLVSFGWQFNLATFSIGLQVIWVIGASMLIMAVLVWLPFWAIAGFGAVVVLGHNALDYGLFPPVNWAAPTPFWHILHNPGFSLPFGFPVGRMYPLLPWIGLMPLGYVLAKAYKLEPQVRQRLLVRLGLALIAGFILIRLVNGYGNPAPWSQQESGLFTFWSFLNTAKYPPSLAFLLMTVGPGLIVLAHAERWRGRFVDWMVTLGRVPFFYYLAHIYLAHALALVAAELQGLGWRAMATAMWNMPAGYGFSIWVVWLVWIGVVVALYPACKWFADLKARRKDWWLSYL
ncbi:DUF1624 domain-containing protein [Kordiimonas lacus]|uniref:Uncharacterized membrane protein n=1 Tax=Kordiimonas lacus TaxID=637679 RepID=A0A1G7CT28_9PROT|nr:heparan-alpha-glucosaminide N-acetyltransferase domain-containing protein [Kordiimonas lacus]SDE41655.1 Uncharacterized membrane protein [Kordiimonas lacus]